MSLFKMVKVLDCTDMPRDIRKDFYDYYEKSNDSFIDHYNDPLIENPEGEDDDRYNRFQSWLFEQGLQEGEHILIKYWW